MRRKLLSMGFVVLLLFASSYCTTVHTVGGGPTGRGTVEARIWFGLFGLVSLNPGFDSLELAGNSTSYKITTEWTFGDLLFNVLTFPLTITTKTVRVER